MVVGRATWKGFIKLSLVSVPVRAFTAHDTSGEIRLNQLHKACNARVRYQKVCPEHGELSADDIVSGYEYAKDQYVVVDPEELAKLREQSDKAIAIDGFVAADAVDFLHYSGKTYYLLPDGVAGNKPYALLRQGMTEAGVVGFVQVVLSSREQIAVLRPHRDLLVLELLHYDAQVKGVDAFLDELGREKLAKDELALTRTLIDASKIADFDVAAYKDRYVERLRKLIQLKIDGKEVVQAPDVEEPKIINLMDALKRSVAQAQAAAGSAPAAVADDRAKLAPSKKTAKPARKASARKRKSG